MQKVEDALDELKAEIREAEAAMEFSTDSQLLTLCVKATRSILAQHHNELFFIVFLKVTSLGGGGEKELFDGLLVPWLG